MTTQIIAQNILTDAHFLSAGSQASGFWGQPQPAAANTGKFRLLSQGDAEDFSFTGTTTANGGDAPHTSLIDSALSVYGDDYFIGGTVVVAGETRTVSDFAQATGTITVSAEFTNRVMSATAYTLTVSYATRAFQAILIAGGDAGDATFKWTHDPTGPTWLGRVMSNWIGNTSVVYNNVTAADRVSICQAADGTLIVFYNDATDSYVKCRRSSNLGLSFDAAITISTSNRSPRSALTLKSGRVMVFMDKYISYSDDHGLTWTTEMAGDFDAVAGNIYDCIEMASGVLMAVHRDTGNEPAYMLSPDGGFSWTASSKIRDPGNALTAPCVVQAENGNIVCAYSLSSGDYEIRCKISENGGYTWGNEITILNEAVSLQDPSIVKDINGRLYVFYYIDNADQEIISAISDDHGATWSSSSTVFAAGGKDFRHAKACLADGFILFCIGVDITNSDLYMARRGFWGAYSANACPAAINAIPQRLVCGAELIWHGSGGVAADAWTFGPEYDFAMENLIADSPSKPWRTAADNADYAVVLDLGTNARFFADGVAFFGANVREVIFEMTDDNDWATPLVHQHVDFTIVSGIVDDTDGNAVQDTSLLASYVDHELKGLYLRILVGGAAAGNTWKILDNVGTWILLDTTAATAIADADTFAIFGTKAAKSFTAGLYRYVRILIEAQQTTENYYQIGYAALGRMVTLASGYTVGFGRTRQANVDMLRTPAGGMIPIRGADPKNVFELTFPQADLGRRQLVSILDAQRGQNMVLIPDSADLLDVHLVKAVSDARQTHKFLDRYDVVLTLEEVL